LASESEKEKRKYLSKQQRHLKRFPNALLCAGGGPLFKALIQHNVHGDESGRLLTTIVHSHWIQRGGRVEISVLSLKRNVGQRKINLEIQHCTL
jgi:hypothetical protein